MSLFNQSAIVDAIHKSNAVIEFKPDGTIITANENFLNALGYKLNEIKNRHHSMFVDENESSGEAYKGFWKNLNEGLFQSGIYKRFGKDQKVIWINASYNPIMTKSGKVTKIVKFATDITATKLRDMDYEGQLEAIHKSNAVIEFDLSGNILKANKNFLDTVGYSEAEIIGKHHSIFVDPTYAKAAEYKGFWESLRQGKYQSGEFKRFGKGGQEIWIQASYNPINDDMGRPMKIVKFASNITDQKFKNIDRKGKVEAIGRSNAVIEFTPDGIILDANENFTQAVGYSLSELKGQHHRIFCEENLRSSQDYKSFWASLKSGVFQTGEYKRIGKGGKIIWIQASYNPIFDDEGKVIKVVKFASDVTKEKLARDRRQSDLTHVLDSVGDSLLKLSNGDLAQRLTDIFPEEYEKLRLDFNEALSQLNRTMGNISFNAQSIRSGASEISQSSHDLATRTERQAAALEETAAALEEITATVAETARGADDANKAAAEARREAESSETVVSNTVTAMSEIAESSDQITKIISVIDEIAFQTNLLALNAGVEAARAGEAGRGFAVVATEVRALAQRSSDAAEEIKSLISASSAQVKNGVDLVGKTGSALQNIMEKVVGITQLISGIHNSTQEQSKALSEVNLSMIDMDKTTQQNAAMVEESNAASQALNSEADGLYGLVQYFKTSEEGAEDHNSAQENVENITDYSMKLYAS